MATATSEKKETSKHYIEATGRRKEAVARVRLLPGAHSRTVNGQEFETYFPTAYLQAVILSPFTKKEPSDAVGFSAHVSGGGPAGQAVAIRHGISRALVAGEAGLRTALKHAGFLKRDPRKKERKKFGLKKARRAPQWSKR